MNRSTAIRVVRPLVDRRPGLKRILKGADEAWSRMVHSVAESFPGLIRPQPRQLTVAVTAACNLRCQGCRYGRDFMVGERLALDVMLGVLDDAHAAGVARVRFYGGEPLLHPDLPRMVRHASELGMDPYVTTNGLLLGRRMDELVDAGMTWATMGFYGVGSKYDEYTQRSDHFERLERSLESVRERYPHFPLQLNWTVLRPTCNLAALREAWDFAKRFDLFFHLDLYTHDNPFFTDGPSGDLGFRPENRPAAEEISRELLRLKESEPERIPHARSFLRSVPDWLILGKDMRVPCDAYQLLWVGADGSLKLCDVSFPLGNVNETPLRDLLFGEEHRRAAREAFELKCPNCTCKCDSRIRKHAASHRRYA